MSAVLEAPTLHRWVDRLDAAQAAKLRSWVATEAAMPPIEDDAAGPRDDAVEHWLRTTVKATGARIKSGEARLYTPAEVEELFAARRAALA
ncbi:MAG: hypothetical protein FWG11_07805 [Promicromonosporaceae bacterium]|nr:hypothetical protein [Promicromonosporaceae bacterium]